MNDLFQFTDEDLIEELANRFDEIVFAGRKLITTDGSRADRIRRWKGDRDACIGLVASVTDHILKDTWDEQTET